MNLFTFPLLIMRYATLLTLILHFFYYQKMIEYSSSMSLITCIVFVGGIYLTYIKPKLFLMPELNIRVEGYTLKLCDFIFHHIPFYYFIYMHLTKQIVYKKDNFILGIILIILYFLLFDPRKLYNIEVNDIIKIIIASIVLCCFILNLKNLSIY
jgi:hypothetical protein